MRQIIASFALLALLLGGCGTTPTPEAVAYDTIREAQTVIKARHALFEVAVAQGRVSTDREREVREAYVKAERSIASAAQIAATGFNSPTPEETRLLVEAFLKLVTTIIPPGN